MIINTKDMIKGLILFLTLFGALIWMTSCEKEPESVPEECLCGKVLSATNQNGTIGGTPSYALDVANNCTGNVYTFTGKGHKNAGEEFCSSFDW